MTEHAAPSAVARTPKSLSLPNLLVSLVFGVLGIATVSLVTGGTVDLTAIAGIAPLFLLAAFGLILTDWALEAIRLMILCRALGERVGLLTLLRIVTSAMFVARVTPFNSGGDPFQIYSLTQLGMPLGRATAAVAVKSLLHGSARVSLGLAVPVLLAATTAGWEPSRQAQVALYLGIGLISALVVAAIALFVGRGRVAQWLRHIEAKPNVAGWLARPRVAATRAKLTQETLLFADAARRFGHGKGSLLARVWVLSLLGWSSVLLVPVVLVHALGGQAPASAVAATSVVFYLAAAFGPTPGSSGSAEMAFAALFNSFVAPGLLGALVLVWRMLTHYLGLVAGILVTVASIGVQHQGAGKLVPGIEALGGQGPVGVMFPDFPGTEDLRD